ncbi:unnamed protein product [Candidula unifasciata]|uniref:Uncharacterized protein n=1 Tax=Candidula unifasciata TaxID=100452 RepID=A0A8S3Z4D9_9EUPU|nr:unnamed protein product [Candidula unifasciata]
MNLLQSHFTWIILVLHIIIYAFQVDANVEFQSTRRSSLGNVTFLEEGVGSSGADNKSVLSIGDDQHLQDLSVSLQTSAGKSQSTAAPEPRSVPDSASRVNPKVEETSTLTGHSQENHGFIGKGDLSGADEERDDSKSWSMISATESLDKQGVTVNGGQEMLDALTLTVHRMTASTDDPATQSGLPRMAGAGSTDVDNEYVPSVNGKPGLQNVSFGKNAGASKYRSTATPEPKSLPGNASTAHATAEEISPRDDRHENPGFMDKRGFSGADRELENDSATKGLAKDERGVTVKEEQVQNLANTPTEDPPPQPDLLLLAKLKEIKEMEKTAPKSDAAYQHHVAAIHAVMVVISMMTASCLVRFLWER